MAAQEGYGDLMKRALLKLQEAQAQLDAHARERHEGIAIVGMGCRFPGGVDSPEGYWRLLREGRDTLSDVPADRWDAEAFFHPDPDRLGAIYCRRGNFLEAIDRFEPRFFGISPREAARMDPQHRLLLEVAWEALESSGREPTSLQGSRTGVFVGMMGQDYTQLATSAPEVIDAHTGAGNSPSIASGRLAYTFGFMGPGLTIDTACSSSLVAVHLAVRGLRQREVDFALAGGVNLVLSPVATLIESRARMLAPDGRCKTFDAAADGIGRGEGCGVLVLRRLSDALAAGDPIIAVIRGSAINHDGRTSGLTVPNGLAQQSVIRDALKDARVEATDVGYVEAHGTGTSLGDPIELEALGAVYGDRRTRTQPLVVGSMKTNLGHLEGAAGVAGLMKAALCLAHEEIPPHLHLVTPTPHVDWRQVFIEVPTASRAWTSPGSRFAAVSSFGFSGTNAHLVLESAPPVPASVARGPARPLHVLTLSARTDASLRRLSESFADVLDRDGGVCLPDLVHTAHVGRSGMEERVAVLAKSSEEMAEALRDFSRGTPASRGEWFQGRRGVEAPRVAWLFSGQGAQYVGMGRELFETERSFREDLLRFEAVLRPHLDRPLTELLFHADEATLQETRYTQPALVALEVAVADLLRAWGLRADAVLGHSVGEYAAAVFAGVLTAEECLPLVAERARLMQDLPERGAMLAVFADAARVAPLLSREGRVSLAALNGPRNTVVSGAESEVEAIARALERDGVKSRRLKVSHAFHSPLMEPMVAAFEALATRVHPQAAGVTLITNHDGAEAGADFAWPSYWARHIREPVRFEAGVRTLLGRGIRTFLEVGPKPMLSELAREVVGAEDAVWLETLHPRRSDLAGMLGTLARLHVQGATVDWGRFDGEGRRRISLPTYPFERQRHWLEVPTPWAPPVDASTPHPLLGARWDSPGVKEGTTVFSTELDARRTPLLGDHRVFGRPVVPMAAFLEMVVSAAAQVMGTEAVALESWVVHQPLVLSEPRSCVVQTLLEADATGLGCKVVSRQRTRGGEAPWTPHVTCRVVSASMSPPQVDAETWRRHCATPIDLEAFAGEVRERGLEYGPALRVLSSLHRGEGAALSVSEVVVGTKDFRAHPALLDACLRTAAAIAPFPSDGALLLPVSIQRVEVFRPFPSRVWAYATHRTEAPTSGPPTTDLTLTDEEGSVVAILTGLAVRRAEREVLLRSIDSGWQEWLYRVGWSRLPSGEALRPAGQDWWVFHEDGGLGEAIVALFTKLGARVTSVRRGTGFSSTPGGIRVDPACPEHFARWCERGDAEPPQGLLYLWGLETDLGDTPSGDALMAAQVSGCVGALHAAQAWMRVRSSAPARWVVVTRGTQRVGTDPRAPRVIQSPLWGFGQALATELPELRCLRVDLPVEPGAGDLQALLQACALPESEGQVAIRSGALWGARLERVRPRAASPRKVSFSSDASYLITGGLGGLGPRLAAWLTARGVRHLVLMGRHAPTEEVRRQLALLEAQGVSVRIVLGDVCSAEVVSRVLTESHGAPPVRGIFHAAGVLRDATLGHQSMTHLLEVLAPKVQGAWNLHRLSAGLELDCFVCFSSVASLLGSPGQANYVAANAFLDALAHLRQSQGLPALTLDWGSWDEVGMAARLAREGSAPGGDSGLGRISVAQGLDVLERLLGEGHAQLAVLPVDWLRLAARWPGLARQALVQGFVGGSVPGARPSDFRARLEGAAPHQRRPLLHQHVAGLVARTLGLPESERLSGRERLFDLGFDSLLAVELKNRLAASLGRALRSTLVFDFPSVEGLVGHLATELGLAAESQSPEASRSSERETLAAQIQGLSEQELTSLIDHELESALAR
ncbi:type I polyketide synthase [Myxococcus sp. K15C18031901]|uniref:type I polyketide synthase n=1 Tax=Myxococcus dinghuensis TaxID=2906761 RepID=UPI0020A71AA6|nr:type I polyketide synthase [Myxococcus dinghuensis]MCP3102823.1 type I polyketide synthase [Myxococcus dinghuensis]